jgi:hypothetical protein
MAVEEVSKRQKLPERLRSGSYATSIRNRKATCSGGKREKGAKEARLGDGMGDEGKGLEGEKLSEEGDPSATARLHGCGPPWPSHLTQGGQTPTR